MSLRDVERAMIVFIYFYEKMNRFRHLIDEKKIKEEVLSFFCFSHIIFSLFRRQE